MSSSNPAVQLTFTLRTSPTVRTVHLLGSWDNYQSQLPLTCITTAAKPGSWRGAFRFQGSSALKLGSRYWYYYIVDGYHVSHDPAKEHVTEKTTGRKLNILDVPTGSQARPAALSQTTGRPELSLNTTTAVQPKTPTTSKRMSRDIPVGRALSPGRIQHPRPQKPHASRGLREADYEVSPVDELELHFASTRLSDRGIASSPSELSAASSASSGTVFSASSAGSPHSSATSPSAFDSSSNSSGSDSGPCRCRRFGVTRDGRKVMLDCGGKRCGYASSSASSECDDEDESSEDEKERSARIRAIARARMLEVERAKNGIKVNPNVAVSARRTEAAATVSEARRAGAERRRR